MKPLGSLAHSTFMLAIKMSSKLNRTNINSVIKEYMRVIDCMKLPILPIDPLDRLKSLKRTKICCGPYPNVSEFEAANRILTDVVMLFGIRKIIGDSRFDFDEYIVEYGHGNSQLHDIVAVKNGVELHGECFNVSASFFQPKKTSALKKLRANKTDYNLIVFNKDAMISNQELKLQDKEFAIIV